MANQGGAWMEEAMNKVCHGEERNDAAIQLEFRWIATPAEPGSQ